MAIAGGSVVVPALPAAYTGGAARTAAAAAVPGLEVLVAPPAKVLRRGKGVVNTTRVVDGDTEVKRSVDLGARRFDSQPCAGLVVEESSVDTSELRSNTQRVERRRVVRGVRPPSTPSGAGAAPPGRGAVETVRPGGHCSRHVIQRTSDPRRLSCVAPCDAHSQHAGGPGRRR